MIDGKFNLSRCKLHIKFYTAPCKKIRGICDIFLPFRHLDLVLFGVEKLSKKALKYKEVTDMRYTFKCTHARVGLSYALLL